MRPRVPDELRGRIKHAKYKHGYSSDTEFVVDAVRRRLEELED